MRKLSRIHVLLGQLKAVTVVALLGASFALPAVAQVRITSSDKVTFPVGLKWERMREVEFRYTPRPSQKSLVPSDLVTAQAVWADEISKAEASTPKRNMFVLVANSKSRAGVPIIFSMLDTMDFERCEPSKNGKDMVDMYSKCLARVAVGNQPNPHIVEFNGFCYLNLDFPETPIEQNNTQFAFDAAAKTAYFRVIQYGKPVTACNRSIKLEGV